MGEYKWGEKYTVSKVSYENGVESFKFGNDTGNNLWINQENMYIVDEEQVENIYNQVNGLIAYSFEGKTIIDPALDVGDKIIIDGKPIIYQGEADFQTRFIAEISSKIAIKQKQETTTKETSQKVINRRVQSRIDEAEGKITQLVEETTENSQKISQVEQTVDGITQMVENLEDFTRTVTGTTQIHLNETIEGEGYVLEFKIKGNTEKFKYLTPESDLTPSDNLVPNGGYFNIICDKQSRTSMSNEAVKIEVILPEPLRNLNDVYDELNIIDSKATVTRRIGVQQNGTLYLLDTEETEVLEDIILQTFEDDTYIYIQDFQGIEYTAKYIVKNEYSEQYITKREANTKIEQTADNVETLVNEKLQGYATTEELNTAIQQSSTEIKEIATRNYASKNELINEKSERVQTASEIRQEVSRKVGDNEVISKINQSAEAVGINANKIELSANDVLNLLSGNTINLSGQNIKIESNNFNLNENGSVIANDFTITGGKINLPIDDNNPRITIGDPNIQDNGNTLWISQNSIYITNQNECQIGLDALNKYVYISGESSVSHIYPGSISVYTESNSMHTEITGNGITTPTLTQTSLENQKKNFEKLENAIDIIKQVDIYKYNLKSESDTDKKHIGFVIGNNYKYSKELTSKENNGADIYSLASCCLQAIKEQQTIIEKLENRIDEIEGGFVDG